ncbi:MAG: hypothetical protein OEX02_15515 [Cyclobacteriaceae bacterium]|nr:hypothetical protein [Cyclobacteriaceae bacterium]
MKQITLNIPDNKFQFFMELIKNLNFVKVEEGSYKPEFVEKIQESRQQAKSGETVSLELDEIWKE